MKKSWENLSLFRIGFLLACLLGTLGAFFPWAITSPLVTNLYFYELSFGAAPVYLLGLGFLISFTLFLTSIRETQVERMGLGILSIFSFLVSGYLFFKTALPPMLGWAFGPLLGTGLILTTLGAFLSFLSVWMVPKNLTPSDYISS